MILKKQGKTDDEIMRFWGISLYRLPHDQLTEEQVRKYTRVHGISLCFYCRNARPGRCAWIARYEPIWEKAETRIIKVDNGRTTVRDIEATVVRECKHYQPAKEVDYYKKTCEELIPEVHRLRQENKRYREALETIGNMHRLKHSVTDAIEVAKKALEGGENDV